MFKNIIFDWSGVVKDAFDFQLWVVNAMFEKYGVKQITLEELKREWVQPYMKFYNKYIPGMTLDEEMECYKEIVDSKEHHAKFYPGMPELIKQLKRIGRNLFVVSSDYKKTIMPEIKNFGLDGIFDEVVMEVHDKTESIREIISKNGFKNSETVFIGDSNHEIEVGKDLGIKTIAVTWGFASEENLKQASPDYLAHNIKELESILLK